MQTKQTNHMCWAHSAGYVTSRSLLCACRELRVMAGWRVWLGDAHRLGLEGVVLPHSWQLSCRSQGQLLTRLMGQCRMLQGQTVRRRRVCNLAPLSTTSGCGSTRSSTPVPFLAKSKTTTIHPEPCRRKRESSWDPKHRSTARNPVSFGCKCSAAKFAAKATS